LTTTWRESARIAGGAEEDGETGLIEDTAAREKSGVRCGGRRPHAAPGGRRSSLAVHLFEHLEGFAGTAAPLEARTSNSAGRNQIGAPIGIIHHRSNALGNALDRLLIHLKRRPLSQVLGSLPIGGHHRTAGGHCLEHRKAARLEQRWQQESIGQ
jgi:hypothetical protein